jgi:flagellar basal-body rod modification protein FlgD
MNINRNMDFRHGSSQNTDMMSVNNSTQKSDDNHVEQMRQKVGTEFTADMKRQTGKKKNELGKDDFMKLMSAQLKYQDPINPMKNEEMAAQLAQFSALEQMMNVNNTLEKMVTGQKPSEHMLAASLIGKRVSTDSTHFQFEKGSAPELTFNMPADAKTVSVAIVDAKGEVVREIDVGELQKGEQSVRWDGKNSKAQEQPLGEYSYRITAEDKDGKAIAINNDSSGIVTGITFEGGKSVLLVGDKKVAVDRVSKIEQDVAPAAAAPKKAAKPEGGDAANPLAAEAAPDGSAPAEATKQNSSNGQGAPGATQTTSPQVAKNNLPPELTPEKIKSMLGAMGAPPVGNLSESNLAVPQERAPDPLWNPATN